MSGSKRKPRVEWMGAPLRHAIMRRDANLSVRSLCGLPTSDIVAAPFPDKPLALCWACKGALKRGDRVGFAT